MDIKVKRQRVIGEVQKSDTQKIQVGIVDSNIGEFVTITDMYQKTEELGWNTGKGKWLPANHAKEICELMTQAVEAWENDEYEEEE